MLDFLGKDCKSAHKYAQRTKETILKELKECKRMISHQIETINKRITKNNEMEILELKSITETKNWLEELSTDLKKQKKEPSKLDRSTEIIQS